MVEVEEFDSEEEQQAPVRDRAASDSASEHADDGDASEAEAEDADVADDDASLPAAPSALPPMGDQFQHLLQLASHLKSSQPEVREKRAQWDRLQFHQKNTVIWQKQDAAVRYDLATAIADQQDSAAAANDASSAAASSSAASSVSSEPRFDSVRFPLALHFKSLAGAAFARGAAAAATSSSSSSSVAAAGAAAASAFQEASLSYQRAMGLFAWGRKSQTKDGDEIEWRDLTDPKAIEKEAALAASTGRKTNEGTPQELEAAAASTEQFYLPAPILTAQQRQRAQQLLFTCLINVAACEEKLQQWSQVIAVCEAALAMDLTKQPASAAAADGFNLSALTVKALFRAATAYTHLDDLERSLALLTRASKLSPKDATIAAELQRLRSTLERQREKDKKHFGGFLQRKNGLTDSDAEEEAVATRKQQRNSAAAASAAAASSSAASSASSASAAAAPSSSVSMAAADQTKQFLSSYLAGFREQAAKDRAAGKLPAQKPRPAATKNDEGDDEVDGSIDTSSASARRSRVPVGPSPSSNEDLASLYADARANFGLDLSDPLVQQELQRLQEEHKRTGKLARPPSEEDEPASASASGAADPAAKARPPRELQKRHRDGALGPSDLASTEPTTWRGGFMLFCIILAAALRWMKIL